MFIAKNAWKSIVRSKGRNILIGIIVLVIATSSCVALAIRNSAIELVKQEKESYTITATLGVDRSKLMQNSQSGFQNMRKIMKSIPSITLKQLKNYADSTYVKSLNYQLSLSVDSSNISAVSNSTSSTSSTSSSSTNNSGNGGGGFGGGGDNMKAQRQSEGDFTLVGYSSKSAMSEFISGTYKIKKGSMFSDGTTSKVCVITDQLAKANSLTTGSKITFTNPKNKKQKFVFKVVGIYTDKSTSSGSQMNFFSNSANQIITNYTAANNIAATSAVKSSTKLNTTLSSSFTMNSAGDFNKFKAEITAKGLSKYYTVTSNIDSFDTSVAPLSNLINFATIFLILVLIIGSIILVVLNMFNIRERKYEVGVLRAIGMKKGKVAMQFVIELFVVTFMALTVGTIAGGVASVPVATYMLKSEISSQTTQQTQVSQNFGNPGGQGGQMGQSGQSTKMSPGGSGIGGMFGTSKNVSYVNQINAVISGKVILEIIGIGILLTLLSSLMSMIFISRYEPLKILSSRT